MRRTLIGSTVLLAAALALTGCSAASNLSGAGGGDSGDYSVPQAPDAGIVAGEAATDQDGSLTSTAERQVIISGNVTITADDPIKASRDAVRIVETAGGRVDGRT
jgi:hypothetical protein